jgi:cytochrome c2
LIIFQTGAAQRRAGTTTFIIWKYQMEKILSNLPKYLVLAVMIGGLAIIIGKFVGNDADKAGVAVNVPSLSPLAIKGKTLFENNCQECHGKNAGGTDQGPPFIHPVYRPGHHGDQSFVLAAMNGVRAHHWRFGNMPKQPQVKPEEVLLIVRYIRELQRANGLN